MSEFNDIGFTKSNAIGKLGEKFYRDYVKQKGFDVLDVSDDPYFQSIDVDLIISTIKNFLFNDKSLDTIKTALINKQTPDNCILVDVKTDTVGERTGNFYLEWIAHYKPGCFSITKADKWVYLYWDQESNTATKIWSINVPKLRQAIVNGQIKPGLVIEYPDTLNSITLSGNIKEYRSKQDINGKDPGMYAWILPMLYLNSIGVAKEIKF